MTDLSTAASATEDRTLQDIARGARVATDPGQLAIVFENVTKTYEIQQRATPRLGAWVVNKLFEHLRRVPFDALHDVSFRVAKGEMLGFVGHNGAGKSTVLKLAAGITQPTSGRVAVRGRVTSLLELGVGFHPELSGMENIFYNGAIMGLSREETHARLEAIIEFSGLRKFLFEPVKHYSSGMYARLACSVAMHLDPEIILVDEILVVGDAEFQQRGMMRVFELHERGVTIVLVTHEVPTARDLCDRLIWLDHGRLVEQGDPREVSQRYLRSLAHLSILPGHFLSHAHAPVAEATDEALEAHGLGAWRGRRVPRLLGLRAVNAEGSEIDAITTGEPLRLLFDIDDEGAEAPYRLAFAASWPDGQVLFEEASPPIAPGRAGEPVAYDVPHWPLLKADVHFTAAVLDTGNPPVVLHRVEDALSVETRTDLPFGDCVMAPKATWSVRRVGD
ncbi:MAG: polysaccharide ABC transporter ATP-binding protein [Sumerlaeia bacterium]